LDGRLIIMIDVDSILSVEELSQIAGSLEDISREPGVARK
jgi:hypothetical protein